MKTWLRAAACGATLITVSCSDGGGATSKDGKIPDTPPAGNTDLPGGSGGGSSSLPSEPNGAPSGGLPFALLRPGDNSLLGIAAGDVVYVHTEAGARSLEATLLTGGDAVVITTLGADDRAYVRGGVVAFYKGIQTGLGTLGLWTRGGGLKDSVATLSAVGFVVGSVDGSRVAFGVNGTASANGPISTDIAVTNTSAPTATSSGAGTVNVADSRCRPDVEMVGNRLFAAFCTPTVTTRARLVTVDAQGTLTTLVTNPSNGGIQPFFSADAAGSKLFVIGPSTSSLTPNQGRIVTVSPPSVATLENDVEDGFMTDDGSAAIFIKGGALKRATAVTVPVTTTLIASGILGIQDVSKSHVLFSTQAPADPNSDLADMKSADLVTANQPGITLVGGPTASSLGFATGGDDALYLDAIGDNGATLNAIAVAGGTPRALATDVLGAFGAGDSSGAIVITGASQDGDLVGLDLGYVPLAGGSVVAVAGDVLQTDVQVTGKRVVYQRLVSQGGGLYVTTLP